MFLGARLTNRVLPGRGVCPRATRCWNRFPTSKRQQVPQARDMMGEVGKRKPSNHPEAVPGLYLFLGHWQETPEEETQ